MAGLVREALAISVGVALALGGQAWFEGRSDRTHGRELLQAVLQEMESNQEGTNRILATVRGRRLELQSFHDFLGSAEAVLQPDSVLSGAARLLRASGSGVVSPALDEALQSGNLRLIQDPDLRLMLSQYQDRIRTQREFTDDHQDWTNQQTRSFLIAHGRIDDVFGDADALGTTFPPSHISGGGDQLIGSREFENYVRDQLWWALLIERRLVANLDRFADYVHRLGAALDAG